MVIDAIQKIEQGSGWGVGLGREGVSFAIRSSEKPC